VAEPAPPATVAVKASVLRRLELDMTRRLDGLLTGDHLAMTAGPGTEQAGARPYEPGDDARRMDWNLTARTLSPHVRTTDADREMETWAVADRSASLDFGTANCEKPHPRSGPKWARGASQRPLRALRDASLTKGAQRREPSCCCSYCPGSNSSAARPGRRRIGLP
jgi:hypothetical protein